MSAADSACLALQRSDPKAVSPEQYRQLLSRFVEERCMGQLRELLLSDAAADEPLPFPVRCTDLVDFDPSLAYSLLHYPKLLLPIFGDTIFEMQMVLSRHPSFQQGCIGASSSGCGGAAPPARGYSIKERCHVRLMGLPPVPEFCKATINDIRSGDSQALVQVIGTIVRSGGVRMLEVSKQYECQKCEKRFTVVADPEQDYMLPVPRVCPAAARARPGGAATGKCGGTSLREIEGSKVCVDYQEIKIQDQVERLGVGGVPRSITVILEADLVDKYNPGDDVVVTGELLRQWRPVAAGRRCEVAVLLRANSVATLQASAKQRVVSDAECGSMFGEYWNHYRKDGREFEGRDNIVNSICPQLYGLYLVKLALLMSLVGGCATKNDSTGVRRRSQSHLLLVGDPGCGKSQLLRYAANVSTRSVLTTGIGTTGSGLTCTAVKDGADWAIEAGALVLANEGVCCIDEFASIKEHDMATIHEAMEQQTLSIAKAGLVVKLNTRTCVIACCNPKGVYDITADLTANTAIASPLLSRFDLVLILLDAPHKEWDKKVSTFLLMTAIKEGGAPQADAEGRAAVEGLCASTTGGGWSVQTLRHYLSHVRSRLQPAMTREAMALIMRYYQLLRSGDDRSRTTVRLLESLMRLSQAHAKVMFRDRVEFSDAIIAITLVSLSKLNIVNMNAALHCDFPASPSEWYEAEEQRVLLLLGVTKERLLGPADDIHDKSDNYNYKRNRDDNFGYSGNNNNANNNVNIKSNDDGYDDDGYDDGWERRAPVPMKLPPIDSQLLFGPAAQPPPPAPLMMVPAAAIDDVYTAPFPCALEQQPQAAMSHVSGISFFEAEPRSSSDDKKTTTVRSAAASSKDINIHIDIEDW